VPEADVCMTNLNKCGEIESDAGGCPRCGEPVKPKWKACPACGASFVGALSGGKEIVPSNRFVCPGCGEKATASYIEDKGRSRICQTCQAFVHWACVKHLRVSSGRWQYRCPVCDSIIDENDGSSTW
jgi:hypothetical protein